MLPEPVMMSRWNFQGSSKPWKVHLILAILQTLTNTQLVSRNPCQKQVDHLSGGDYLPPVRTSVPDNPWCESELVPDVIDAPPPSALEVQFGSFSANFGNILTPTQLRAQPTFLSWMAEYNTLYTLVYTDPDAPSRQDPFIGEFLHWIVGNMPCCDPSNGDTLAEYFRAGPPRGTGLHRHTILVFKQPGKIDFEMPRLTNQSFDGRVSFSARDFARQHRLQLVAGNFFQTEYDLSVEEVIRELQADYDMLGLGQ